MKVLITAGPIKLNITPRLSPEDFNVIREKLTFTVPGYKFTRQHREYGWNGQKTFFYKNQSAPTGCLYRVWYLLKKCGHEVSVEYTCNYPPLGDAEIHGIDEETFVPMKFQKTAVSRIVKYRRGIVQAPVRAGKTAIMAMALKRIEQYPAWVITYGTDLINQTRKALQLHLQMPIGVLSEGEYEPEKIIVTSYQAITRAVNAATKSEQTGLEKTQNRNKKILESVHESRVFIFDECQHALAPKNKRLLNEMYAAGYVIGLSGTPKPDKAHHIEVEAAIGSTIFKVKYRTLIKHNRLAQPIITMYRLPYKWYSTGLDRYADIYQSNIIENMLRNQFIADIATKLRAAEKTSFIMIRNIAHGPLLQGLIPDSRFVRGSISGEDRAALYEDLQQKKIYCIIATVGKEGLNIPKLDAVINAEGLSSSVITIQKMRSLTASEGKKYGIVIDFVDRGEYLNRHSKRRIQAYKRLGKNVKIRMKNVISDYYPMEGSRWLLSKT